jgi:hypothetical protein
MLLDLPVSGIVLGAYPWRGLVTAEARLATMLAGHTDDHRLIPPKRLVEGARLAEAGLRSHGIVVEGPGLCSRVDLAAELLFPHARDGLAFLAACERCLHLPRLKQWPVRAQGQARLESIAWLTAKGRNVGMRLYDAGALHGTHAPGHRLRLERERRWHGKNTPTPEAVVTTDLAAVFRAPMRAWLRRPIEIAVTTPSDAIGQLFDSVRDGTMTRRRALSLSASVNALSYASDILADHDRRRRVRDLRGVGVTLDHLGEARSLHIDLREPLAALAAAWETRGET